MSKFFDVIIHAFLPNRCMFCHHVIEYDQPVCEGCRKDAPTTDLSKCLICGQADCHCQNYFRYLLAPFYYEMGADNAVRDLKFHNNLQNAKWLGICMTNCMKATSLDKTVDVIIPAPLYKNDLKNRGYNQASELGKAVAALIQKPILEDVLIKVKKTKKQHNLSGTERYKNLIGAFAVQDISKITGKTVLLVDDVFTTGSTMNGCAKALVEAGAKEIICLVCAKTRQIAN